MRDDFTQPWTYWSKWAYLLFVVFLLMLPVFMSIYISFNVLGFSALEYEFTFEWYRVVLEDTLLVDSLNAGQQAAQQCGPVRISVWLR